MVHLYTPANDLNWSFFGIHVFAANSILQDANVQSWSKKWWEKRAGAGEREGGVSHYFPPPPLTQIARIIFLLGLFRDVPVIWGHGIGYVLETVLHTAGVSLIRCGSLTSSVAVPCLVITNGCRELNYRLWLLLRTWNFYIRLMLVSFSAFWLSYIVVWLKV